MADEITPEQATEFAAKFVQICLGRAAELHLKPFVKLIGESLQRSIRLVSEAAKTNGETSAEILRAVVVLNHAYLEDFLRNLALWLLPIASEETLNEVPLPGSKRGEKFSLGKLAQYRGKQVDDLIAESVAAYIDRSTFNNVTEIMSFLDSVSVKVPREDLSSPGELPQLPITKDVMSYLDDMMKRRHQIVHRADQAKTGGLREITEGEVLSWLVATLHFTLSVATETFKQWHSFAEFRKLVRRAAGESDDSD